VSYAGGRQLRGTWAWQNAGLSTRIELLFFNRGGISLARLTNHGRPALRQALAVGCNKYAYFMKKTVFISSTYIDLKEERKRVWEALEKFDVIVKGMEEFGARKTDPLTTCLTEVEQADIYVGIIGMRFGSEEPQTQKSYTQLEYEKALELQKNILIYLLDEENASVTPSLIQFDKAGKLASFKSILRERHTVDTFSNAQDLVIKLRRQFEELLTPKEQTIVTDDYENTKKTLSLFFLVPKAYTGREIKLKIKFIEDPKPVSKALCDLFKFEYGKTIVSKIEVLHPKFDFQNFSHIFIEYSSFKQYMELDKKKEYEIFAKVLFKEEKAKALTTNFMDRIERVYNHDPDPYDDYYEPPEPYVDVLKKGDGQIALSLKDIVTPE
jgi:hypothetical protein